MNRSKLLKMFAALAAIIILVASLTRLLRQNSMSLTEYAQLHPTPEGQTPSPKPYATKEPSLENDAEWDMATDKPGTDDSNTDESSGSVSQLTGAMLNGTIMLEKRYTLAVDFYYEPLSLNLRRYITGVSYPAEENGSAAADLDITFADLCYVHILHYDFDGNPVEGELICNKAIAQDLLDIFYELYRNEYQLERVLLIDEYDGDDTASMADNNTSCFNYRAVKYTSDLSDHALGLAIDVNPLYNPLITYNKDGSESVSPAAAYPYADRSLSFPYKIDENDLCYKLFIQHGFIWGGNWNDCKDYQHFQKVLD